MLNTQNPEAYGVDPKESSNTSLFIYLEDHQTHTETFSTIQETFTWFL